MSCADVNNSNSQAIINLDRVGKELANSCSMLFVQRGEEIKQATIDKSNSCGSTSNSNTQTSNQSNDYSSIYNSNSLPNSQNSSGSVGTSSMNRGGKIVTTNSNSQNSNNQQEEVARRQQERIRQQQEKTNQEVEKANQDIAKAKEKIDEEYRISARANQDYINKTLETNTNTITQGINNAITSSVNNVTNNAILLEKTQDEFFDNNLTDKEIDALLEKADPNDYSTIHFYNLWKGGGNKITCHTSINGRKIGEVSKDKKIEYRIYSGSKLVIQYYAVALFGFTGPLETFTTRIRKGKIYHFAIKRGAGNRILLEQLDEEPLDKKGNKFESVTKVVKSDIEY